MEFNPNNPVIKRCMKGMHLQETGNPEEAAQVFLQAWNEASDDFEKFISAWYIARLQKNVQEKIHWSKIALKHALKIDDEVVKGSFLTVLYSSIANHYEYLGDMDNAERYNGLALASMSQPSDKGPFYHGTRADLKVGDLLTAGRISNYKSDLVMNHIYFTAMCRTGLFS
jgi:hypothetical protein